MEPITFHPTSDVVTFSMAREENGQYKPHLTSDEVAAELSSQIANKTIIITGIGPDGMGTDAARAISAHHPKLLILASRNEAKVKELIKTIVRSPTEDNIRTLALDLSSLASVRKAAKQVLEWTSVVDVIVNNAGVMMTPDFTTTAEGVELQFGVNHLGHFLFTNLLVPALLKAGDGACVVNVSSAGHRASEVNFDDVNFQNGESYDKYLAYARSKTANLLFSIGIAQKLGSRNIRSFGVDPGAIAGTRINRDIPVEELKARGWWDENGNPNTKLIPYKSIPQGAANHIVAAFDKSFADQNGACLTACVVDDTVAPHASDKTSAAKLWALSEKLVGQEFKYD